MLMNLVNLLGENEIYSNTTIAEKLGVNDEMLKQMLNDLAGFGYVENINHSCSSSQCKKCASHSCSSGFAGNQMAMWILTEKGKKAVREKAAGGDRLCDENDKEDGL